MLRRGGRVALPFMAIFKECCVKTSLEGLECYSMKANYVLPYYSPTHTQYTSLHVWS